MFNTESKIFDITSFKRQLSAYGFDTFWSNFIKTYMNKMRPDLEDMPSELDIDSSADCFKMELIGELYEIALEHTNKISKKELGQYYTPRDTADFMAKKLLSLHSNRDNIADVCCGTGNLIVSVLENMPYDEAVNALKNKRIWLYDLDKWALKLAVMKIAILFVQKNDTNTYKNITEYVNCALGNFLEDSIVLPTDCNVISNPPYGKLPKGTSLWFGCETYATNEMYAIFIEKIVKQAKNSVIISPQSFLGSNKFALLRGILSNSGGQIYAFDNVPASIFNGKKHGIFNTNSANSVRAAITVVKNTEHGFRITPLMRFKSTERDLLFKRLDDFVGNYKHANNQIWFKTPKTLEDLIVKLQKSTHTVSDLVAPVPNQYKLTVPSTPRYFVTASARNLDRGGAIELYAKDKNSFDTLYVLLNSTISYLWWRICDGGITLTKDTLMSLPVPDINSRISDIVLEGVNMECFCIKTKLNAGKNNENIKFPDVYRKKLNQVILSDMEFPELDSILYGAHDNSVTAVLRLWT